MNADRAPQLKATLGFFFDQGATDMKLPLISAGIGFTCFVLGSAIILFVRGGPLEDAVLFGRTLAISGAIILGAAIIAYAIIFNSRKP